MSKPEAKDKTKGETGLRPRPREGWPLPADEPGYTHTETGMDIQAREKVVIILNDGEHRATSSHLTATIRPSSREDEGFVIVEPGGPVVIFEAATRQECVQYAEANLSVWSERNDPY